MARVQRCRVCRCSELEPCNPPCAWVSPDLCSSCYELAARIREWSDEVAHRPSVASLLRLARELNPGAAELLGVNRA